MTQPAILLLLALCVWAQKPSFEVASIKPSLSGTEGGSLGPRGNELWATNMPLENLLMYAYSPPGAPLLREQVIGAPEWARTDRFDIQAKTSGSERTPAAQMRIMMQSLLEDRFQLKAHRETRELPVYNLVRFKSGPKPSVDQTPPDPKQAFIQFASAAAPVEALPRGAMRIASSSSSTTLTGTAISISQIVMLLQGKSDRIISDKSGFTGLLDVHLEFSPNLPPAPGDADTPTAPSIFTAIQEIGLKLDSAKAPLEVLVIESVHKPTGN